MCARGVNAKGPADSITRSRVNLLYYLVNVWIVPWDRKATSSETSHLPGKTGGARQGLVGSTARKWLQNVIQRHPYSRRSPVILGDILQQIPWPCRPHLSAGMPLDFLRGNPRHDWNVMNQTRFTCSGSCLNVRAHHLETRLELCNPSLYFWVSFYPFEGAKVQLLY